MKQEARNEKEGRSCNSFSLCAITLTLINTPPSLKKVTPGAERSGHFIIVTGNILRVRGGKRQALTWQEEMYVAM